MIDIKDLIHLVIIPACELTGSCSLSSIALVAGTCAQESQCGQFLIQRHYYPIKPSLNNFEGALGIFQMERNTHDSLVKYLSSDKNKNLKSVLINKFGALDANKLTTNLLYAGVMCRLLYKTIKYPIPIYKDVSALAHYYKKWYNTELGSATVEQFIDNYHKLVNPYINDLAKNSS